MLTPQEVSNRAFTKAVMGGYNMAMVDEFLDELTDDYTALYRENAALKAKMKVLVEKVEEYRATEDSMRATLLTAQRMADSIVHEAEAKRDEMMKQARASAEDRIADYRRELVETEERLRQGQLELSRFIAATRDLCGRELQFLENLPQLSVTVDAPEEEADDTPTVQEIEEQVMAAFAVQEEAEIEEEPAEEEYPEEDPFVEAASVESTCRIDLSDLKFGRNYGRDD